MTWLGSMSPAVGHGGRRQFLSNNLPRGPTGLNHQRDGATIKQRVCNRPYRQSLLIDHFSSAPQDIWPLDSSFATEAI